MRFGPAVALGYSVHPQLLEMLAGGPARSRQTREHGHLRSLLGLVVYATVLCVYRSKSIEFLRFFRVLVCLVSCIMSPMRRGIIQAAGEAPGTPEHPGFKWPIFF